MVSIRLAVECNMDVIAPLSSCAPCGAQCCSPGPFWALARSQPYAAWFHHDYFLPFRGCAEQAEPAPFSVRCLEPGGATSL